MKRGALVFAWYRIMLWSSRMMLRGILGTVALFAVVLIGCDDAEDPGESLASGSASTTTNSEETVRVGTLFPHSGDLAWAGPQFHAAVSLAFELVNEVGRRKRSPTGSRAWRHRHERAASYGRCEWVGESSRCACHHRCGVFWRNRHGGRIGHDSLGRFAFVTGVGVECDHGLERR